MRYLRSVRETVDSLMQYYDQLRFRSGQDDVLKYDASNVTRAVKDVESIIEKLEKWEKKVYEEEEQMIIRGGGKVGLFEDKEKATWMASRSQ